MLYCANTASPDTVATHKIGVNVFKLRVTEPNVKSDKTGTKGPRVTRQYGFGFLFWVIPAQPLWGTYWRTCVPEVCEVLCFPPHL